jgi:hypothetical protein
MFNNLAAVQDMGRDLSFDLATVIDQTWYVKFCIKT